MELFVVKKFRVSFGSEFLSSVVLCITDLGRESQKETNLLCNLYQGELIGIL